MFICAKKTGFFSSCFVLSYLNELPLFQFAVISLIRNEVICFSTFFHTFKNFYSPTCWTFVAFASASVKSWFLSCSLRCTNLAFFFSVEIISNRQSNLVASFVTRNEAFQVGGGGEVKINLTDYARKRGWGIKCLTTLQTVDKMTPK